MLAAAAALLPLAVSATPEQVPNTAFEHPAQACTDCHFDGSPVRDSDAIFLESAPTTYSPGETHSLTLRFEPDRAQTRGFLATFRSEKGNPGTVTAGTGLAQAGSTLRSQAPAGVASQASESWSFEWTSPPVPGPVYLEVAANAGNGDASPLGDEIHTRTLILNVK